MEGPIATTRVFRFGIFELDAQSRELRRRGLKIRLPEQSFQILLLLLERPGEVVTRDELRERLWFSDTFVDFNVGLNSAVRKLREALDESADNPRFVETLPRRGYRFIASVQPATTEQIPELGAGATAVARARPQLMIGGSTMRWARKSRRWRRSNARIRTGRSNSRSRRSIRRSRRSRPIRDLKGR